MRKRNIKKITGLTAISTAMGASVNAALVPSINIPAGGLVSPSTLETIYWDIDNDGTNDFSFSQSTSTTSSSLTALMQDLGDARVAGGFKKLSSGAPLGTASDGLSFSPAAQIRALMYGYGPGNGIIILGGSLSSGGWSEGDTGYFGFKFTSSGNTHYGWAEMTLSSSSVQATINEAWYNDTADGAVTVGVIPEPAEFGLGLGALALGAVGLRRMRHNRKAA